ncbi:MAG: HAD family hydrolase [Clostridia bacterium]|nr:HAD family hydrolase [Clostridia bacterium]
MNFETIIFDLDGTLLDTLTDLNNAINHVLKNHGYHLRSTGETRRFLGNGARNLLARSLPEGTDEETVSALLPEYQSWYLAHSEIATAPYEGISEMLDELRKKGVKMAVVSNKGDLQVKPLVKKYFPQIPIAIGEREGIRRKPYTDTVEEAMRLLHADPKTTAFMGDSEVDGQTALNANLPFLAAGWGFRDKEELLPFSPALFLNHPSDLLKEWGN